MYSVFVEYIVCWLGCGFIQIFCIFIYFIYIFIDFLYSLTFYWLYWLFKTIVSVTIRLLVVYSLQGKYVKATSYDYAVVYFSV